MGESIADQLPTYNPVNAGAVYNAPATMQDITDKPMPPEFAPKMAKNGLTKERMPLWDDGLKVLGAHLRNAGATFSSAAAGVRLRFDSKYTVEQARQDVETKDLQQAQMDVENFNHVNQYVDLLSTTRGFNFEDVGHDAYRASMDAGGWLTEQVPMFATQITSAYLGSGIGAMLGGVAGKSEMGAKIGAVASPAMLMGLITAGSHYYEMRKQGVDEEHAQASALMTGATAGITTAATIGTAAKLLPGVANTFLKSQGFKQTAGALAQRLAVAFGINETAQAVQAGVNEWADFQALNTIDKFDPAAENAKFWESLKQGAVQTLVLEGGLTAIGTHAGMTAVRQKIKSETARINFERSEATRKATEAQAEQTAEQSRQGEVKETTAEAQAQAAKRSGMFDADHKSANVQAAQHAVEVAEARYKTSPKETQLRTKLELAIAKAKLQQAKFNAKTKALTKAYNDPNLVGNLTQDKRMLQARIETFEDELDQAATQVEKDHWKDAITRAKKELQDVRDLLDLGGELQVKASVQNKINQLEKAGQNTKKQIARVVLEHRMSERAEQIKTLKDSINHGLENLEGNEVWYQGVRKGRAGKKNSSGFWTDDLGTAKNYAQSEGPGGEIHVRLSKDMPEGAFADPREHKEGPPLTPREYKKLSGTVGVAEIFDKNHGIRDTFPIGVTETQVREKLFGKAIEDDLEAVLKQNKISDLELAQDVDAMMRARIDDKTNTIKLEDAVDDTLGKPAIRIRTLVGIAKEIVERASNRAEKETRNQIEGAQHLLEGAVRASRLSPAAKDSLASRIKAYDFQSGKDEFFKLVGQVNSALDVESHQRAVSFVTKLVGKIGENMKVRTKKEGTIEKLMYLKAFASDPLTAYKFAIDFINHVGPQSAAQLERWDMAQMFLGADKLKDMSTAELKRIAMTVIELNKEGESKSMARSQGLHNDMKGAIAEFHKAMRASPKGEKRLEAQEKALGKMKKLIQLPAEAYSNYMIDNIYTNNVAMTQYGEVSDMSHVLDFNAAFDKYHKDNRHYLNVLKDSIAKAGVTAKQLAKILIESAKPAGVHTYDWVNPETGKPEYDLELIHNEPAKLAGKAGKRKELTWGQMLDAAFKMTDKENTIIERFKNNNRFSYTGEVNKGRSTQEVIETALDDKFGQSWRNLRTGIQDFYQEFHPVVADLADTLYGRQLERNPTYAGPAYAPRPDAVFGDAELTRRTTLTAGSAFGRETSKQEVVLDNFWDQAVTHIRNNTRTRALYKISRLAHAVYNDPDIVAFVRDHIGEKTVKNMHHFVDYTLLGQAKAEGKLDKPVRWWTQKLYAVSLKANPGQFAAQITGVFNIFRKVNPVDAYKGWAVYMADPQAAREMMYGGKLTERFDQSGQGRDLNASKSRWLGAVELGDKTAVELSFPVFWEEYSRTGDLEKARTNFARFIDETQSTGNADMLPPVFTAGPLEKLLTVFGSEGVMQGNTVRQQWVKYRSTGRGGELVNSLFVITVAANAYAWAKYAAAFPYMTDKERENNAMAILDTTILQAAAALPIIGGVISNMQINTINLLTNQRTKAWEVHAISADPFSMLDKAQAAFFASVERGEDAGMRSFNQAVGLLGFSTGWPVSRHIRSAEALLGVRK